MLHPVVFVMWYIQWAGIRYSNVSVPLISTVCLLKMRILQV